MELISDWKNFEHLFFNKKKSVSSDSASPVFLILRSKVILAAYSENDDLGTWVGATVDEITAALLNREFIFFEKEKIDQWIGEAGELSHFYDQLTYFRSMAKPYGVKAKRINWDEAWVQGHFLLEAVQTWWCKLFPAQYGIFIQLDSNDGPSLLMVIKRGKIHSFHDPDLSTLAPERRKQNQAVVKYLSGRYMVPVQGFFLTSEEWMAWLELKSPWAKILSSIQRDRNKIAPFNWGLVTLIASRAYLRI
jgi:hypothetical protein